MWYANLALFIGSVRKNLLMIFEGTLNAIKNFVRNSEKKRSATSTPPELSLKVYKVDAVFNDGTAESILLYAENYEMATFTALFNQQKLFYNKSGTWSIDVFPFHGVEQCWVKPIANA